MGPGSARKRTTAEAVRRATQHCLASLRALAKRYGINQKTVAKWQKRTSVADLLTAPREPGSMVVYPGTRRSTSPFVGIPICLWMIAFMCCRPPFRP